jgi:septal ring factor EnvC (AmiA/AmiB activator)
MLLLLLIAVAAATTPAGGSLDIPPAPDPKSTWIAIGLALLPVMGTILAAKIQSRKGSSNGPTPLGPETPRLDVGEHYLRRHVETLEERVKAAEAESRDLRVQIIQLIEDRATFKTQNEALRADLAEQERRHADLRDELHELRGQLRGRGHDR